ncbi:GNAT family N-acetyltransferase [Seonamhaeicola algicola]|uniref:GNAT family N-acetyltransferase n=1 Tax=Seonamhaeicola algicola TaxID=1719036 RepID=A0A5C7AI37_9FLAO|nr:GNAT family N-acetyltransferase [Seonamhaeicola algicola]TXE06235.1 GNAT family N-acetyltransferase [Seonamhaeicola algicola]
MSFNFRKAQNQDLPFLLQLEKEVFPAYQQNSKQNIKKSLSSNFQEIFIVEDTIANQAPIGAFVLFKYTHSLRIYSVGLIKAYHNKGIGSIILNYIKTYAAAHNFNTIILEVSATNQQLINWYKKHNFTETALLNNYYTEGLHAIKMKYNQENATKDYKNIIVINQPFKWQENTINAKVISVKDYINNTQYHNNPDYRIFNLCSSYKYQSYGYYVSLLASARGQRVIPSITVIRDFRIKNVIQSIAFDLDALINKTLLKISNSAFSLNIYFGQTPNKSYRTLASKLYQIFEAPFFKVNFIKNEKWLIKDIKVFTFQDIDNDTEKDLMYSFAVNFFNKKRHNYPKLANYKYDLAVLVNPKEETPPSNALGLEKLKIAANKKGVYLELITKADVDKINEFDALFIRETTNVNHYTYEFSRLAYAEGMVVIDDPWSILRCSNKIYQNELFKKHKIKTPQTIVLANNISNLKQLDALTYPVVLKQPDSAFSLGVIKVNNKEEAKVELLKLFKKSDMVICQEFLYSEFDWRIGILDNTPLFACKYFMKENHWQIYDWNSESDDPSGDYVTLPINEVPEKVIKVAQKAAALIGDGLYGVDLKIVNNEVYIVEVNDNPNIDAGVEDSVLGDALYDTIIDSIINRINIAKNIQKIKLTE